MLACWRSISHPFPRNRLRPNPGRSHPRRRWIRHLAVVLSLSPSPSRQLLVDSGHRFPSLYAESTANLPFIRFIPIFFGESAAILFFRRQLVCFVGGESMVDVDADEEKGSVSGNAREACAQGPVVYQLVRVEGDGTLVPATDVEVMEVEHLLEDDRSKLPSIGAMRCAKGCAYEGLSFRNSNLEGLLQSETDSRGLDATLEEKSLRLLRGSHNLSPKQKDVDGQSSDHPNHSQACNDKLQPDNSSLQTSINCTDLNGRESALKVTVETQACNDKLQTDNTSLQTTTNCTDLSGNQNALKGAVETSLNVADETVNSRSSVSEPCTSSHPDFSILKGEICLDDLSIRELQETFRATFGRQTSVKDKLWLKRRIAMGLTNSCHIPTTGFVIKENKIVHKEIKEAPCMVQKSMFETDLLPCDQVTGLLDDDHQDSLIHTTNQIENHVEDLQVLPGKRPRKPLLEYDTKGENFQMEQCAGKRVRKPTRRYIEEFSDDDTRECTGRSVFSVKNSSSSKSQIIPIHDIGSWGTTFVMRQGSIGGSHVQIPYVSRVRRGRPRKNFMAFTNFVTMERERSDIETSNSEELDLEHGKLDSAGDNSDDYGDKVSTFNVGARRKHHRAWTLCEVLKLVEGVARYGAGRWSEIRRLAFASYSYRTSVDLKDKWRNLLRASFAQDSMHKSSSRNHAAMPLPISILSRVRELAEMQSQAGVEFGPSNYAGHVRKIVQGRGSGFL